MTDLFIVNASHVIVLAKIGHLHLLRAACAHGFHLDESFVRDVLRRVAGEEWNPR